MATEYGVYGTICTMHNKYYTKNLYRTSNLLNFHTAPYSLTQKAVTLNTCRMVSKFLTERWIKSIWQVGPELF